jgi:hypothetical protein
VTKEKVKLTPERRATSCSAHEKKSGATFAFKEKKKCYFLVFLKKSGSVKIFPSCNYGQ